MLVICEDCAKKYNIDETKIHGPRARFSCHECGHIIVVHRPGSDPIAEKKPNVANNDKLEGTTIDPKKEHIRSSQSETLTFEGKIKSDAKTKGKEKMKKKWKGVSIRIHLLFALIIGFVSIAAGLAFLYLHFIPQIINQQVDLRTSAITTVFAGSIQQPLLVRNYLQVNKEAKRISKLPGVAYAAVVNKRGIVVAGFFNDLSSFDQVFAAKVKAGGFPREVIEKNPLDSETKEKFARFSVGGQRIQDKGVVLAETGGAVHVGIYISEVDRNIKNALLSTLSLSIMGGLFFCGILMFLLIARSISTPLIELTDVVNRISLGELELTVEPKGPREVRELAYAYERMRYSIKAAIERLKKR